MRIAIVNRLDSAVEAIRRVLLQTPLHELAWVARDGAEAVKRCASDTPDLVLMDLIMPELDGVETTRRIMARTPCAIIVVTTDVEHNSSKVFEAMGAGAVDAVNTPALGLAATASEAAPLLRKLQTVSRLIGEDTGKARDSRSTSAMPGSGRRSQLVVVGASAGGPAALATVLSRLPKDFPAAMLIVQHVDPQFSKGLANWLSQQTKLRLRLAQHGDEPKPGTVLLAGTEYHLAFTSPGKVGYTSQPHDSPYRPSIDVLFKSIHSFWRGDVVGVILTGMGRDGAVGLKSLHRAGHRTIVQDEATSAVFGMPKAAIQLKAATEVLPLDRIGPRLTMLLNQKN